MNSSPTRTHILTPHWWARPAVTPSLPALPCPAPPSCQLSLGQSQPLQGNSRNHNKTTGSRARETELARHQEDITLVIPEG